jgi:hypothetical protein
MSKDRFLTTILGRFAKANSFFKKQNTQNEIMRSSP